MKKRRREPVPVVRYTCEGCGRRVRLAAVTAADRLCCRCRRPTPLDRGPAEPGRVLDDPLYRERVARYTERAALGLPLFED